MIDAPDNLKFSDPICIENALGCGNVCCPFFTSSSWRVRSTPGVRPAPRFSDLRDMFGANSSSAISELNVSFCDCPDTLDTRESPLELKPDCFLLCSSSFCVSGGFLETIRFKGVPLAPAAFFLRSKLPCPAFGELYPLPVLMGRFGGGLCGRGSSRGGFVARRGLFGSAASALEAGTTDRDGDSSEREMVRSCLGPLSLSTLPRTSPTDPIESRGDSTKANGAVHSPPVVNGTVATAGVALLWVDRSVQC